MMKSLFLSPMDEDLRLAVRASQFAKVGRNFAPQGSFASFFKVIFRSGLLFPIQDRLMVPGKAGSLLSKLTNKVKSVPG